MVHGSQTWPITDRRRFRNLLLDAVSSDAMPLVELLLRAHDDGLVRALPAPSAPRAMWDAAAARMSNDLQSHRFVEASVARFVAEAWVGALGPAPEPPTRSATVRTAAAPAMRTPVRSAAAGSGARGALSASQASSAASIARYRRTNTIVGVIVAVLMVALIMVFRATGRKTAPPARLVTASMPVPEPAPQDVSPDALADSVRRAQERQRMSAPVGDSASPRDSVSPRDSASRRTSATRSAVPIARSPARLSDDVVLRAGRILEGQVLSVKQFTVVIKDGESGLDFEIPKADIEKVIQRDGTVIRFGDDNVPLLGDDRELTPMSHAGTYRVQYAQRWGALETGCEDLAETFAPGSEMVVHHLRGAPMLKLDFIGGQGFNAAVRSDGLFESTMVESTARGPRGAVVRTRLSGRISRDGTVRGVARLNAVSATGATVCDVALTMRGSLVR
jgi:hypothetical protein